MSFGANTTQKLLIKIDALIRGIHTDATMLILGASDHQSVACGILRLCRYCPAVYETDLDVLVMLWNSDRNRTDAIQTMVFTLLSILKVLSIAICFGENV